MGEHARISPSAMHRVSQCPASVRLSEQVPYRPGGPAAQAGTIMHSAFERQLLGEGHLTDDELLALEDLEVAPKYAYRLVDDAVAAARNVLDRHRAVDFLTETRVHPGRAIGYEGQLWGTADLIGIGQDEVLIVGDAKFGRGLVSPELNDQMLTYAVGALEIIDFEPKKIALAIFQPVLFGARPKVWECSIDIIGQYRDHLAMVCDMANDPAIEPTPSEDACRWCPALKICPTQAK